MVCLELETCFKGDGEVRSPLSQTVGTVDFLYYKDSCSTVRTFNIFFYLIGFILLQLCCSSICKQL